MRLPKFSKKLIAIGAAAGIAMGAAGIAAAYLTGGGSGTGSVTVSSTSVTLTVTPTAITTLAIGVPKEIDAVVQNNTKGALKLTRSTETIAITTVTPAAGSSCTSSTFALFSTDGWTATTAESTPYPTTITFVTPGLKTRTGPWKLGTHLDTNDSPQTVTIPAGDYFDANVGEPVTARTNSGVGEHEYIVELTNPTKTQKGCEGATITLKVTV